MRIREVMSARPIMVSDHEPPADLQRLMEAGRVHHLPVVEGGRLVGVWTATDDGPLVLLGPERVHETHPDIDAAEAVEALLRDGAELVFVWDSGVPAGILTRSDVLAMVRSALGRGIGRRHPRPCVLRLAGPAGAGKTTLLVRTLPLLGRLDAAVVQANVDVPGESELSGARAVDDPHAHWRAGLKRATDRLSDAQLIFLEDRDGPVELSHGIGEDAQVAVVPLAQIDEIADDALRDAQALVVTRVDEIDEDRPARLDAVRDRFPGIPVFPVAAGRDDRGLDAWARWVEAQVLSRRG